MRIATDKTFEQDIIQAPLAVVMFSAPWAGPCNLVRPSFESTASRYGNQITFAEFILDDNPVTPETYGVRSIPLFMLFRDGVPEVVKAGALPAEVLTKMCEDALDD